MKRNVSEADSSCIWGDRVRPDALPALSDLRCLFATSPEAMHQEVHRMWANLSRRSSRQNIARPLRCEFIAETLRIVIVPRGAYFGKRNWSCRRSCQSAAPVGFSTL